MLRLERYSVAEMVDDTAFSNVAAVEEIAGVKLQARLGGGDLHRATTRWFDNAGSEYQRVRCRAAAVQNPVVIVAIAVANLDVLPVIYSLTDRVRCAEIERRALHGRDLTSRYQRRINGRHRI